MAPSFSTRQSTSLKSPSTPNRKNGKSSSFSQAPSTTPAGEPPIWLTNPSTTPAGRPPRNGTFGSSSNAANNTFGHLKSSKGRGRGFAVPESSPPLRGVEDDSEAEHENMLEQSYVSGKGQDIQLDTSAFMSSVAKIDTPRGLKRSRNGQIRDQHDSGMTAIARSYVRDTGLAALVEQDDVILHTEHILSSVNNSGHEQDRGNSDEYLMSSTAQVTRLWSQYAETTTNSGGVGPDSDDSFTKANYLASLLLQLHTPHSKNPSQTTVQVQKQRSLVAPKQRASSSITLPKALLDWMSTYHNPLPDDFNEIHMNQPAASASESFWDVIGAELVHGRLQRVIRLFRDAGFQHAYTAQEDGSGRGYSGKQLENVEEVVQRCIQVLESCPALKYEDWDVKGPDWSLFRQRVRNAMNDLEAFSKGSDEVDVGMADSNIFARSANASFHSMAASSMRAKSRVPWTIFENLKTLYGALLGGDEISDYAQDWVEASILLTVWWDGEEEDSGRGKTREIDVSPLSAYRRRLGDMYRLVTEQIEEFQPDSMDPVQVGLACVFEDDVDAVISVTRTLSQTVATATVELAALGCWLPRSPLSNRNLLDQGFSSEDLMVLSHGPGQESSESSDITRDGVLTDYAELLAAKHIFRSKDDKVEREGWELAVSVLGRLDDVQIGQSKVSEILDSIELADEARTEKVLGFCVEIGLEEQARGIAERYADDLAASSSPAYGAALFYYARAHCTDKLQSTISLLISLSLLHSSPVPAAQDLDPKLASLLKKERPSLDADATSLLFSQLSGYATIRRFYDLRDRDHKLTTKREASTALLAIIESASDCIRGGLFDAEISSVVGVDNLLVLFGETLPLLLQSKAVFTKQQIWSLLRIVEDWETCPGRIREGGEELLRASMRAYRGVQVEEMDGSGWDLLASSTLPQAAQHGWDWRKGLDAVVDAHVGSADVVSLVRNALAKEVARLWSGAR